MNAIQLRNYQERSLNGIRLEFSQGKKKVILCAPTGAGKTVMFSSMAQQTLSKSLERRVLILTDRKELLSQAGGTLGTFGIHSESIKAGSKVNHRARCFVGMVETYYNRLKKLHDESLLNPSVLASSYLNSFDLVIMDEAHKGTFFKVFDLWKLMNYHPFTIGATATPKSARKSDPLSNYFDALVNEVQIPELVDAGFLSPCITYAPKMDRSKLKKDGKDYSEQSQFDAMATRVVYEDLLKRYGEICERYNAGHPMQTVCFNINVRHSKETTRLFNDAGIPAIHIDGTTPDEIRDQAIKDYKAGLYKVICNVGILNAGFDDPFTRCVIFNRATSSVQLWLQSCGRGSRIAKGKENFIILDMGSNWKELQLWDSDRDWNSIWKGQKPNEGTGVAPMKECSECDGLVRISLMVCPHCGNPFPVKAKPKPKETEFAAITAADLPTELTAAQKATLKLATKSNLPKLPVDMLVEIQDLKKYKAGWLLYVINDRAESEEQFMDELKQVATLRNYRPGWIARQKWNPKQLPA